MLSTPTRLVCKVVLNQRFAFTIIELMVVLAVIAILAALLLPTLSSAKKRGQSAECINNLRQLHLGWLMYADEHENHLAPNSSNEEFGGKTPEHPSWVAGWLRLDHDGGPREDSTNVDLLVGVKYAAFGSIGQYVKDAKVYRCPGDKSTITILGQKHSRTRSTAMNAYMNSRTKWNSAGFRIFTTLASILRPSDTWVFIDEREDSINDGCFAVDMVDTYAIIDYPATYHNGSSDISFADGHVDSHRWLESTTMPPLQPNIHLPAGIKYTSWNDRDMAWLTERTTSKIE